eukprot:TRINITY_DN7798_c0_g1_i2.p2 TRINITY_DN7798_c0_g1~~TRINITY_DN7798_c0_g1_i2.p2  ORF type:complete len:134 (+),score=17.27 TRINITY_DN7798_c0_g1_i2:148-549(+)
MLSTPEAAEDHKEFAATSPVLELPVGPRKKPLIGLDSGCRSQDCGRTCSQTPACRGPERTLDKVAPLRTAPSRAIPCGRAQTETSDQYMTFPADTKKYCKDRDFDVILWDCGRICICPRARICPASGTCTSAF